MSLDTYEMWLELEDTFALQFAHEELARVKTVGDLHRLICQKTRVLSFSQTEDACLSRLAFFHLRQGLEQLRAGRISAAYRWPRRIRPSTPLAGLCSDYYRREFLRELEVACALPIEWQDDASPPDHLDAVKGITLLLQFPVVLLLLAMNASLAVKVGAVLELALSAAFLAWLYAIQRTNWVRELETCGDVAMIMLLRNRERFASGDHPWKGRDEEIWEGLVEIVSDKMGVQRAQVGADSRFVEDLGA